MKSLEETSCRFYEMVRLGLPKRLPSFGLAEAEAARFIVGHPADADDGR